MFICLGYLINCEILFFDFILLFMKMSLMVFVLRKSIKYVINFYLVFNIVWWISKYRFFGLLEININLLDNN